MFVHETNYIFLWVWAMCWTCMNWDNICTVLVNSNILFIFKLKLYYYKNDTANTLYKIYDKNSIIECELIVYCLDYIVHTALHA